MVEFGFMTALLFNKSHILKYGHMKYGSIKLNAVTSL